MHDAVESNHVPVVVHLRGEPAHQGNPLATGQGEGEDALDRLASFAAAGVVDVCHHIRIDVGEPGVVNELADHLLFGYPDKAAKGAIRETESRGKPHGGGKGEAAV